MRLQISCTVWRRPRYSSTACARCPGLETLPSSPLSTSGAGRLQTRLGPFTDQCSLEFSKCPEDVENQLPSRRIRVDRLCQALQPYALGAQRLCTRDEVLE